MPSRLTEPVPIADIFCERVGKVELIDDVARITFCVTQTYCGERERTIVCRVILPQTEVPQEWLALAIPTEVVGGVVREPLRH